jgi:hypothetical protein
MNDWIEHPFDREDREIREAFARKDAEISRLKALLTRAADALDQFHGRYYVIENCDCAVCKLTRELRKAAQ